MTLPSHRLLLAALLLMAGHLFPFHADAKQELQAPWVGKRFDGVICVGEIASLPSDYLAGNAAIVEKVHFTRDVEGLIRGSTTTNPADDIVYMLNKFPNHHRALNSRINLQLKKNIYKWPQDHIPTAECYVQRAISFSPRDSTSRMLYGLLLHRSGKHKEALAAYRSAEELSPSDTQIQYNIGLLLFDMGSYDESVVYATRVYNSKFPVMGLQNKLKRKGLWSPP